MTTQGDLTPISGLRQIYEVTTPYARAEFIQPEEILLEAHPYSTISHISALVFHGLTDQFPNVITLTKPSRRPLDLYPLDTVSEDWMGIAPPPIQLPKRIDTQGVLWSGVALTRYFGFQEYHPHGPALRVTNVERTLLDALQSPDLAGGIDHVLAAWRLGRDSIDVELLIDYVERLNVAVLRQRVGFVLERLALPNRRRDAWLAGAHRGGSSKLVADAPYSPTYDPNWNLSINAPVEALL